MDSPSPNFTNYISYLDPTTQNPRIGHLDVATNTIQPLVFAPNTPIPTLYHLITAQALGSPPGILPTSAPLPLSSVSILAPLPHRDVLCIGKNYRAHATEFATSGFDASDTAVVPAHPVFFTKRWTSIVAHGDAILPHPGVTATLDYEGEIGVVLGTAACGVRSDAEAWGCVWGFTIVNDVTARERQRDHRQFFLGKSLDGGCPMGPIAVPKEHLPAVLRVQTRVNGELRQDATTEDLIFSIPYLIRTASAGMTLMPGDVIATGTPAGVGIGFDPPKYLQPGDEVSVSVTGLGTLTNRVAEVGAPNTTLERLRQYGDIGFPCIP